MGISESQSSMTEAVFISAKTQGSVSNSSNNAPGHVTYMFKFKAFAIKYKRQIFLAVFKRTDSSRPVPVLLRQHIVCSHNTEFLCK